MKKKYSIKGKVNLKSTEEYFKDNLPVKPKKKKDGKRK